MAKRKRIPDSVSEIVRPGEISDTIARLHENQAGTRGLVIVYLDNSYIVSIDVAGVSDLEALGMLETAKNVVLSGDIEE